MKAASGYESLLNAVREDGREIPLPRDYRVNRHQYNWINELVAKHCPQISGAYLMVLLLEAKYDGGENDKA